MRLTSKLSSIGGAAATAVLGSLLTSPAAIAQHSPMMASTPGAAAVCGARAFVTNSYSDTLSVIDVNQARLLKNLPTGKGPVNPTFNRDWSKVYVANSMGDTLTVIDARTARVIDTIPAGRPKPSGLRFLPDGRHLIISYLGHKVDEISSLGVMDLTTGHLVRTIPVGAQAERFDITPDGKKAYVANLFSQSISVVDIEQGRVIKQIPSPESLPFNVLMAPSGKSVFAGNTRGQSIIEIDTKTDDVVKVIRTDMGPNGMTFTPDGQTMIVSNVYAGTLQFYNLFGKSVSTGIPIGMLPGHLRLMPDGMRGVLVRPQGRQVSIFDGASLQVIKNIETGLGPSTVAICGNP